MIMPEGRSSNDTGPSPPPGQAIIDEDLRIRIQVCRSGACLCKKGLFAADRAFTDLGMGASNATGANASANMRQNRVLRVWKTASLNPMLQIEERSARSTELIFPRVLKAAERPLFLARCSWVQD
jgi:hypothetical protein